MSELSPSAMEQLVLGYEELDASEKPVVDAYLLQNPEVAARLRWYQAKEIQASQALPGTREFLDTDHLQAEDERAQSESLRRILKSLDLFSEAQPLQRQAAARPSSQTVNFGKGVAWALPLAAVLALVILLPRGGSNQLLLRNLTVSQITLDQGSSRGADLVLPAQGILHSGQAFALNFSLAEDAYVQVYHIGPDGQVSRVFPDSDQANHTIFRGGRDCQIPDPASDEIWILGSETGTETFLVASSTERPSIAPPVLVDETVTRRSAILANLQSQLETLMGQVQTIEFEHAE